MFSENEIRCITQQPRRSSTGADPASKGGWGGGGRFQSCLIVKSHCGFSTDEVHFTTLLWQNNGQQNVLISQMLFYELYKTMVNKASFIGFWGGDRRSWSSINIVLAKMLGIVCTKTLW